MSTQNCLSNILLISATPIPSSFSFEELKAYGQERDITHLTCASYHQEHLVQTFKQALSKSFLPSRAALALQMFLIQYRQTTLYSKRNSEWLADQGKIDAILPISCTHGSMSADLSRNKITGSRGSRMSYSHVLNGYNLLCSLLWPRIQEEACRVFDPSSVNVRVVPKQHIEQL